MAKNNLNNQMYQSDLFVGSPSNRISKLIRRNKAKGQNYK